jgi:hypothetical protein
MVVVTTARSQANEDLVKKSADLLAMSHPRNERVANIHESSFGRAGRTAEVSRIQRVQRGPLFLAPPARVGKALNLCGHRGSYDIARGRLVARRSVH